MFSVRQKREISAAVQKILRDTGHPELPSSEIEFELKVAGEESWSWACIKNNGEVTHPDVNPHNERMPVLETITVRQLRKELEAFPDDMLVVACVNYGDRLRTMQAVNLGQNIKKVNLAETAYSETGLKVVAYDETTYSEDPEVEVVLLNYDLLE